MFGFFKRKKLHDWELPLMTNIVNSLPEEYTYLLSHINNLFIKGVREFKNKNQVIFIFDPNLSTSYRDPTKDTIMLCNIKVFDMVSNSFIKLDITLSSGLIIGYQYEMRKKLDLDISRISIDSLIVELLETNAHKELKELLGDSWLKVHKSAVQKIDLLGKTYYVILDIGDANYVVMDKSKTVYEYIHDIPEIYKIHDDVSVYLQ